MVCFGTSANSEHRSIDRLPTPRHGIIRKVRSNRQSIFHSHDFVETVQYHSLQASLRHPAQRRSDHDIWTSSSACPDLAPLAYDFDSDNLGGALLDQENPLSAMKLGHKSFSTPILMAVQHNSKPFFGLQFHPESICSSDSACAIVTNWWHSAMEWNASYRSYAILGSPTLGKPPSKFHTRSNIKRSSNLLQGSNRSDTTPQLDYSSQKVGVSTRAMDVGGNSVASICKDLGLTSPIILDSEMHQMHEVGQYSIIGVLTPETVRIEYTRGRPEARYLCGSRKEAINLGKFGGSIFQYLKSFMRTRRTETPRGGATFSGGLIGYISYEACLETIGVKDSSTDSTAKSSSEKPDLSFAFVERSIVIDHFQRKLHVQSIKADDMAWVDDSATRLQARTSVEQVRDEPSLPSYAAHIVLPNEENYKSKVRQCQSSIRAGDSYELCLTTQATIKTPIPLPSWPLYQRLRHLNPAPFSAYLRLGNLTLLSSSPERFLRWSRSSTSSDSKDSNSSSVSTQKYSTCQFRPIKGTVKRQPNPDYPPLSLEEATALLSTAKERAENLMIVDLIRHDLHGVVGSGRVSVPKLMVVEEYATLFQLVSVVEGCLAIEGDEDMDELDKTLKEKNESKSGIDVLASSLPPGSMTGAPKLRSCQILRELEQRDRGIYSGVVGYMDVGGGGDFSVVIRSAFRWDDDCEDGEGDTWTIGAGGAVTILSTEDGEWEEMLAKLRSTLRLFENGVEKVRHASH